MQISFCLFAVCKVWVWDWLLCGLKGKLVSVIKPMVQNITDSNVILNMIIIQFLAFLCMSLLANTKDDARSCLPSEKKRDQNFCSWSFKILANKDRDRERESLCFRAHTCTYMLNFNKKNWIQQVKQDHSWERIPINCKVAHLPKVKYPAGADGYRMTKQSQVNFTAIRSIGCGDILHSRTLVIRLISPMLLQYLCSTLSHISPAPLPLMHTHSHQSTHISYIHQIHSSENHE